jgi:hypothetical protein
LNDSNSFHGVTSVESTSAPIIYSASTAGPVLASECQLRHLACRPATQREFAKENEGFRISSGAKTLRRYQLLR